MLSSISNQQPTIPLDETGVDLALLIKHLLSSGEHTQLEPSDLRTLLRMADKYNMADLLVRLDILLAGRVVAGEMALPAVNCVMEEATYDGSIQKYHMGLPNSSVVVGVGFLREATPFCVKWLSESCFGLSLDWSGTSDGEVVTGVGEERCFVWAEELHWQERGKGVAG
ncbi:hypothetical protein WJX72_003586 [[Myrmecia] bisecta]|uniref:Uncharacterized protein n=1 Tax=[Myrmecia] bisecta TaxID=41462 RepID=A0AAW1P034_9CHLO